MIFGMTLTFWGAAQTVTGSMHHLTVQDRQYLLDCGTFQGRRKEARERNSHLPFPAASISSVMLSHAHIDHSGNLPTLARNGFTGPIYSSPATVALCNPMLLDSAYLQMKDAEYLNKRSWRRKSLLGKGAEEEVHPIYDDRDVEKVIGLMHSIPLHTPTEIGPGVLYQTLDAGHLLGSTALLLRLREGEKTVRLLFSGDVGRPDLPVIPDPEAAPPADYAILESTYGDRLHKDMNLVSGKLAEAINRACARGGRIIVPAFAVGRTQQLVLLLHELIDKGLIPSIPMFVDSPLARKITEVYRSHTEALDCETKRFLKEGEDPFGFRLLRYVEDVNASKGLNDLKGPFVVISASGMCEAGRILHHLKNNIENPRNLILITGFQAEHTLGRKIVDREPEVPIFGDMYRVRAEVVKLNEISGHADQKGLLQWLKPVAPDLKKVFLVHGEPEAQKVLADAIKGEYGLNVEIPARGQSYELV